MVKAERDVYFPSTQVLDFDFGGYICMYLNDFFFFSHHVRNHQLSRMRREIDGWMSRRGRQTKQAGLWRLDLCSMIDFPKGGRVCVGGFALNYCRGKEKTRSLIWMMERKTHVFLGECGNFETNRLETFFYFSRALTILVLERERAAGLFI